VSAKRFIQIDKDLLRKFDGDLRAIAWYGCLLDYSKRFRPDKYGFTRISRKVVADDYGIGKDAIYRMNLRLEVYGLIETDKIKRGNRCPIGFKFR